MLLSSLVDLIRSPATLEPLAKAIGELPNCTAFSYKFEKNCSCGISAKKIDVVLMEERFRSGIVLVASARKLMEELNLSREASGLVVSVLEDLIAAGERVHRHSFSSCRVASLKTLFEVLGSAYILDKEGFLEGTIYATPPALGSSAVGIDGIQIGGPAPATLEILCKHQMAYSSLPVDSELTTSTGAALLANLADYIVDFYPAMKPIAVGYGAGTSDLNGRPNVLRILEGESFRATRESIILLETNIDDLSGETVGYVMQRLFKEGAVDVFVTPAQGKKNRPVSIISVITDHSACDRMIRVLMEETGTLGVRVQEVPRVVADRERVPRQFSIQGKIFEVRVKTSYVDGKIISIKPEYEDLKKMAECLNIPLNHVTEAVKRELPGLARLDDA
ncbi:LarC family nickel insertion protein [Methanothrix sp.]|uniref:Nickel pincer cofactor biosynthesis protein LarC n=2 Tax=Methanotrichaceae TaxID=143067 RepID=F4BYS8_METSG|nr:LarC family nickel insertion protein [Methanothrix sp.]AEB67705.1 conserved hypothetical protein TIGR00299 [Methanothrix soehngenii GP6]